MALILEIKINERLIAKYSAVRISGGTDENDLNTYNAFNHFEEGGEFMGQIEHIYGDGAEALAEKLLKLAGRSDE